MSLRLRRRLLMACALGVLALSGQLLALIIIGYFAWRDRLPPGPPGEPCLKFDVRRFFGASLSIQSREFLTSQGRFSVQSI